MIYFGGMTMFNDERITKELGRLYRNGIALATLTTVLFLAARLVMHNYYKTWNPWYYIFELVLIIVGAVVLLCGWLKFRRNRDERVEAEEYAYYFKMGKIFLASGIAAYVLAMPWSSAWKAGNDIAANFLFNTLEQIGVLYIYYNFRKHGININYTFIDLDSKAYYKRVLNNLCKLVVGLLVVYSIAIFTGIVIHDGVRPVLTMMLSYFVTTLTVALDYLLLSWFEKRNYDDERGLMIKNGTFASGVNYIISFGVIEMTGLLSSLVAFALDRDLFVKYSVTMSEVLTPIFSFLRTNSSSTIVALAVCLSFVYLSCPENGKCRLAIKLWFILSGINVLYNFVTSCFSIIIAITSVPTVGNIGFLRSYETVRDIISQILSFAGIGALAVFAYGLEKDLKTTRIVYLPVALKTVAFFVKFFFYSQSWYFGSTVMIAAISIYTVVFFAVILRHHDMSVLSRMKAKEITEEEII